MDTEFGADCSIDFLGSLVQGMVGPRLEVMLRMCQVDCVDPFGRCPRLIKGLWK